MNKLRMWWLKHFNRRRYDLEKAYDLLCNPNCLHPNNWLIEKPIPDSAWSTLLDVDEFRKMIEEE